MTESRECQTWNKWSIQSWSSSMWRKEQKMHLPLLPFNLWTRYFKNWRNWNITISSRHPPALPSGIFFWLKKKIRRIDPSRSKYPIDYTWITLLQGRGKCLRFQDPLGSIYLQCVSFSLARSVNTRKRVTFKRLSVWRLKQQQNNWFTKKYCLPSNHKMISALRNQRRVSRFGTI